MARGALTGLLVGAMLIFRGWLHAHGHGARSRGGAAGKPSVVATTTQIEDVARIIGGDEVEVVGLMPRDADPHSFQPTPHDVGKVSKASVIFENGVGLEGWIGELVKNAGGQTPVVVVSEGVKIARISEDFGGDETSDPHIWMDPLNMMVVTDNVVAGLSKVDADGAEKFRARGEDYKNQLRE